MKSTSGYAFTIGSGVISYNSKKHDVVAQSTAEAKYISLAAVVNQVIWLRKIINYLHRMQEEATTIYGDNQFAVAMAKNLVFHGRTKHIKIKYHFIRDAKKEEEVNGDASFGYDDGFGDDVFVIPRMKPAQSSMTSVDVESDEDSKIKALVNTPALDWQLEGSIGVGSRTQGVNGRGCGRMDGHSFGGLWKKTPPEGYICHRCKVPGHFIQYCPTNGDPNYDFKRPNDDAFKKEIFGCFPSKRSWSVSDLPPELLCPLCKQVMKDAVLTSKCCFKSFCDKCIRDHLIISKLKCECGAANVLADSLIPNMTLRDTINCFVESSCGNSSSGENAKATLFELWMWNRLCSQPQISTKKLPAGSFQESKKTTLDNIEDEANKRKLLDDPYQIAKKARTTRAADVSEATIGSTRMKDTSVLVVEEEVQEEVVSREGGKNRKVAGMEGYVAPYYAAGAMNYGLSPFGTTFNGMMNQASFSMQQMCGRQ
ncbi:hypothetical protein GH714_028486 [Hevea brasiliensis]|uniref:Zinc knuckle CX2CX3GHX4C domain-containing protein n=1 Tax=Hevea brasiliensis TaxID=3981 RepID=A0A6A6LUN1_HEVBR|nr:hypothetical protein GH714_028486 [Hevea brasiliensis]